MKDIHNFIHESSDGKSEISLEKALKKYIASQEDEKSAFMEILGQLEYLLHAHKKGSEWYKAGNCVADAINILEES